MVPWRRVDFPLKRDADMLRQPSSGCGDISKGEIALTPELAKSFDEFLSKRDAKTGEDQVNSQ